MVELTGCRTNSMIKQATHTGTKLKSRNSKIDEFERFVWFSINRYPP
jgi:hypothetical protein